MVEDIVIEITQKIENYKNIKKENWGEVYEKFLNSYNLNDKERNIVLIKVVNKITRDGYSIEDSPFRLVKF